MRSLQTKLGLVLLVLVVTLGLAGCGGGAKEFSEDDFKTIKADMPEAKVTETLGKPKESFEGSGAKSWFYESKGNYYNVAIMNGKVAMAAKLPNKEAYDNAIKTSKEMNKK